MPEDTKDFIHLPIKDSANYKQNTIRTQVVGKKEAGITGKGGTPKGKMGEWEIFSYSFAKSKGWTMAKAKKWLAGQDMKIYEAVDENVLQIEFNVPEPIRNFVHGIATRFIAGKLSHDGTKKGRKSLMEGIGVIVDESFGIPEPVNAGIFANPPDESPMTFRIWKTYSGMKDADKLNTPAELETDYKKQLERKVKECYQINHSLRIYWGDQLVSLLIEAKSLDAIVDSNCSIEEEFTDPIWNDPMQMARRTFTVPNGIARSVQMLEGKAYPVKNRADQIVLESEGFPGLDGTWEIDESADGQLTIKRG